MEGMELSDGLRKVRDQVPRVDGFEWEKSRRGVGCEQPPVDSCGRNCLSCFSTRLAEKRPRQQTVKRAEGDGGCDGLAVHDTGHVSQPLRLVTEGIHRLNNGGNIRLLTGLLHPAKKAECRSLQGVCGQPAGYGT
jgi:hypothetical protein